MKKLLEKLFGKKEVPKKNHHHIEEVHRQDDEGPLPIYQDVAHYSKKKVKNTKKKKTRK